MTRRLAWLPSLDPADTVRPRVFCLHAAGGSTAAFVRWRSRLADHAQVVPVELPGHRNRLTEPLHHHIGPLVDDLAADLRAVADVPYVLVGTSMGALIAFEFARRIGPATPPPAHLVVASCPSPRVRRVAEAHELSDDDFLSHLRRMGATPSDVLDSPELTELLLPAWRADFTVVETYGYRPGPAISVPITVVAGRHDPYLPPGDPDRWQVETTGAFRRVDVDAGHFFFLDEHSPMLLDVISETVTGLRSGGVLSGR
ncbi:thioesterase II family protein [Virgisporangium aurantiacum]|uniref:Thioesterase n=1 Tax=Virgisporangium aurantiacum TaxID=175570 RepID=A0A8J3ZKS8_9ACTN|nr:alpha/beta fold hydrolase [Virgisporangium aurantiacum]GIJ63321.1 thioesterase [Virgisporangium aurantiacum]